MPDTVPASSSSSSSASTKTVTKSSDSPPTDRWKVKLSHPRDNSRVVFSTVSESRARRHVMNRFPRGSEAYIEAPDGTAESYEHERQSPYGEDVDKWAPFDPNAYVPPEEQEPPGQSAWADVEA
jgi:hypothetical protein